MKNDDYIDLSKVMELFLAKKIFISSITTIFTLVGVIYSLNLPNLYKSESVLISTADDANGSLSQSIGNFAALAGIDISAGDSSAQRKLTIATNTLTSRKFFKIFVDKYDLLPLILASKGYDAKNDIVVYDQSKYNPEVGSWTKKFIENKGVSYEDAHEIFWTKFASFDQGEELGVYKLSVLYYSPKISEKWNKLLIENVNSYLKNEEKALNEKLLYYYQVKLNDNSLLAVTNVISALMSSKLRALALIESDPNYAFTPVDPPFVPEQKDSPRRSIIVLLFLILGLLASCSYIILKEIFSVKE